MATTPSNRRPGIDVGVVQSEWIRGYDVPAGDQSIPPLVPCDLIISNGKDQTSGNLSNLIFASRSDNPEQAMFVMGQGVDPKAPIGSVKFHIGQAADPNGIVTTSTAGSLYASYGTPGLWQAQADNTTWVKISDDLGGESLQQTLAIGNTTGGHNIILTDGDAILGESGVGGDVLVTGGSATGVAGNGGGVLISSGTSTGGQSGSIQITTANAISSAGVQPITLQGGSSNLGSAGGGINLRGGQGGNVGVTGSGGDILVQSGRSVATGGGSSGGGRLTLAAGQSTSDGRGGRVYITAGDAKNTNQSIPLPLFSAGRGGDVIINAGDSSLAEPGGEITISSGTGGPAGGTGGNIVLQPGAGGGGADAGIVDAQGIFQAQNIKRGTANPNFINLPGNEGDIYQRTDTGLGQVWANTNGTPTGWVQLAFAGDLVEAFGQLQYGYLAPSMRQFGGSDEEFYSDVGLFKGIRPNLSISGAISQNVIQGGPLIELTVNEDTDTEQAALDMQSAGVSGSGVQLQNEFLATFVINNLSVDTNATRVFVGLTNNTATNQLANTLPGGNYVGFLRDDTNANWLVVVGGPSGRTFYNTGVLKAATITSNAFFYFIIDAKDSGIVRFFILDSGLSVISSITVPDATVLPTSSNELWPCIGIRTFNPGVANSSRLRVANATLTTRAGTVGQGAGTGSGVLSLAQVLINGNETGGNPILINQASGGILGVPDDNAGNGTSFNILGGNTTGAAFDSGSILLASGSRVVVGGTGNTGLVFITSGSQFDAAATGNTGSLTLSTGQSAGTAGATGNVVIATGVHGGGGSASTGDILIAPGSFLSNNAVPGSIDMRGGSTSLLNQKGGSVDISGGQSTSSSGDTGDVSVFTPDANINGDSGDLTFETGNGGSNTGSSGLINIRTGIGIAGSTGGISLVTGAASNGSAGSIIISTGLTTSGNGSDVVITGGATTDGLGTGGNIELTPGTGVAGDGAVIINGKLTVTGLIDPTGLQLTGQDSTPVVGLPAGDGLLWVDKTAVPSRLIFRDDTGTDNDISMGGGGASDLSSLTDVSIAGAVPGDVLTFTGAQWQNLPGAGGSPLATILGIGNETGNTAGGILVSAGDRILGQTDLVLDPGAGVANQVVIDGLRWPSSDGIAGYVLATDGLGNLTFQPGGGGGGTVSFGEAFTRMQWGSVQATTGAPFWKADGVFTNVSITGIGPVSVAHGEDGYAFKFDSAAIIGSPVGIEIEQASTGIELQSKPLVSIKFDGPSLDTNINVFVGLSNAPNVLDQTSVAFPLFRYIGLQLYTLAGQITWNFVTDDATGIPTTFNTTESAIGLGFELVIDATTAGEVTLTLYDNTGSLLSNTTFNSNLPTDSFGLGVKYAATTLNATAKTLGFYGAQAVTRGDLLNAIGGGGGGGSQDLNSVLGIGNETGGIPIKGDDNAGGLGGTLALQGGDSTGGGGSGGNVVLTSGSPDPAGNGNGGDVEFASSSGVGVGSGGSFQVSLGGAGPLGGAGGNFRINTGNGPSAATGDGGGVLFLLGTGGAAGGPGGDFTVNAGNAIAGNSLGGSVQMAGGDGFGTGDGGSLLFTGGDGGAAGGSGGSLTLTPGSGNGGGSDGEIFLNGDTTITGKLTVTGLIDPTGLLLTSQAALPFTPLGNDGGIWINNSGELIYSNSGGDLNLSTAIGGGLTFLDAFLEAGYGMLSPGNSVSPIQSYGIYGGGVSTFVGPGPGQILFGGSSGLHDTDGPIATLAAAAAANSEARIAISDKSIRTDQRFKAVFKFQTGGLPHTDERIFLGFTTNASDQINQGPADDPAANQYVGLREDLAGVNLQFVARGSGGAMVPVFGVPTAITDAAAHYFVIDATAASGDITFSVLGNDGLTVLVSHTEPASFVLPDVTEPLQAFVGIYTQGGGSPHSLDFFQHTVITRADVVDAVTGGGGGGGGNPDLATVLSSGNTTGGTEILVDSFISGLAVGLNLRGGSAGGAGSHGLVSVGAESGDLGGRVDILGGSGGGLAGDGGRVVIEAGTGAGTGQGGSLVATGGSGGPGGGNAGIISISGGDGLAGNALGGDIELTGGTGFGAGRGGHIELEAGVGGATGDGGYVIASAGSGSANNGGVLLIAGGVAPSFEAGTVRAISSSSVNAEGASFVLNPGGAVGGNLRLFGGDATGGNLGGGSVLINSGNGDGSGDGGGILLTSGLSASGNGGNIGIFASNGGSEGGDVSIATGDSTVAGNGGDFSVITGTSANGNGGSVLFTTAIGGLNGDGGSFEVLCGNGAGAGNGGDVVFTAGNGGPGVGSDAGSITLTGGDNSTGSDAGGRVEIYGGGGLATSQGGSVTLSGGDIGSLVVPSVLYVAGQGGSVTIRGGASDLNASGGSVLLFGGVSGSGVGLSGGNVTVAGGPARSGTNNDGGDLQLQGGAPAGSGAPGQITLGASGRGDTLNQDSPAFKFGSVAFLVGASTRTFSWGIGSLVAYTAFSQTPRMIQVTVFKPTGPAPYAVISAYDANSFTVDLYLGGVAYVAAGDEIIHFQAIL